MIPCFALAVTFIQDHRTQLTAVLISRAASPALKRSSTRSELLEQEMVGAPELGEAVLGRSGRFTSSVAQAECSYQCSADGEHQSKEIRMFVGQQACFKTK